MTAGITITRELVEKAPGPGKAVRRWQAYVDNALRRVEQRSVTSESDYANELYARYSGDNGRTWSEWEDRHQVTYRSRGEQEMIWRTPETGTYNPVHRHYVAISLQRVFLYDHQEAYRRFWQQGEASFRDHSFLWVSADLKKWTPSLVRYEEGPDFDEQDWASPGYVGSNLSYAGCNVEVLDDGDIVFPVCANVAACCRILGLDAATVFPSCPQLMKGLIVLRGTWNHQAGRYDLCPSRPKVISDLKSSRGVAEPSVLVLRNGRFGVVFRGSNVISEAWNTRIQQGTPAHKWYTFSDDGGQTWTDPVPWHFDNREVFYSPATISRFLRSRRNGRAYWFGNITGPEAYANGPRYPLVMAAVDDKTGFLQRDTYTVIEDRDPQTESDRLQLSNFTVLDDRETGRLELSVTKLGARSDDRWRSDAYRYLIELLER